MTSPKLTTNLSYELSGLSGVPKGRILRITPNPKGYVSHPDFLSGIPKGERPVSGREYGILRGLAKGSGDLRDAHHLDKIVLTSWDNGSAVSCVVAFPLEILRGISQAGYAAHTGNGTGSFHELKYALQDKSGEEQTGDSYVLAVRKAWTEAPNKRVLPLENWTRIRLNDARHHKGSLDLLEEEGVDGLVTDLGSIRGVNHVNHIHYWSLTAQDLLSANVAPDSGLVIARPSAAGVFNYNYVSAHSQFYGNRRALSVAVVAPKSSTRKEG